MKFKRVLALLFSLTMIFLTGAIPASAANRQFVIPQKFTETIDGEKATDTLSYHSGTKTLTITVPDNYVGLELPTGIKDYLVNASTDTAANRFVCLTRSDTGFDLPLYRFFDNDLIRYGKIEAIVVKTQSGEKFGELSFMTDQNRVIAYRSWFSDETEEDISEDQYKYDKNGNISQIITDTTTRDKNEENSAISSSNKMTFQYDSQNRLKTLTISRTDVNESTTYSNYKNGFPQKEVWTIIEPVQETETYSCSFSFNSQNQLTAISNHDKVQNAKYTYNSQGYLTSIRYDDDSCTFSNFLKI